MIKQARSQPGKAKEEFLMKEGVGKRRMEELKKVLNQ